MTSDEFAISYALARHVPDMDRGFMIQTNYGDLVVSAEDAKPFIALTKAMLERQRAQLKDAE